MHSKLSVRRPARLAVAALLAGAVAACNDSTGPEDDHADEVESIRLTVAQGAASESFTYTAGNTQRPTLVLPVGTSTVTATFLADDGDVVEMDADDHALAIEGIVPAGAFTFTRTGAFTGTVEAPLAAAATANVCMTHGGHCDLEFVGVVVQIGG